LVARTPFAIIGGFKTQSWDRNFSAHCEQQKFDNLE